MQFVDSLMVGKVILEGVGTTAAGREQTYGAQRTH